MLKDRFDVPQLFRTTSSTKEVHMFRRKTMKGARNYAFKLLRKTGGYLHMLDADKSAKTWITITEFMPPISAADLDDDNPLNLPL
jgi:hypothetical protein